MAAKLSDANIHDAHRLYESGQSVAKVAAIVGHADEALRKGFHRLGLAVRSRSESGLTANRSVLDFRALYQRYIAGEDTDTIGVSIGRHGASLRQAFRRRGWRLRTTSEAKTLSASQRTPEERSRRAEAAHNAVRGRKQPVAEKRRRAKSVEALGSNRSASEIALCEMLVARGLDIQPCKAVHIYNVDIATGSVAVEIFGGGWHHSGRHAARFQQRTHYLLDHGWNVLVIWVDQERDPLTVKAADYVVAFAKRASRKPTAIREYRVIRGAGQEIVRGCAKDNHFPIKPPRKRRGSVRCDHDL